MKIIIATTTYYRSHTETRCCLAKQMFQEAREAGHTVVAVDNSPESIVTESLRETGAHIYPQLIEGMGPSRRQAFYFAYEASLRLGCGIILWTEAEKVFLIRNIPEIVRPIAEGRADIVIPARSAQSWDTWPAFQRETEQQANSAYAQATGLHGFDPMHGPVAFNRATANFFMAFDPTLYEVHDKYIQHYAPLVARAAGRRVVSVLVGTSYPQAQRAEEEDSLAPVMKEKRIIQRDEISADYLKMATILK